MVMFTMFTMVGEVKSREERDYVCKCYAYGVNDLCKL